MIFNTDYKIEDFALKTSWEDFPDNVKEHARMCAIDLFGALIIGSKSKQFEIGNKLASTLGLLGNIQPVGSNSNFNLLGSAISMGHASNSFDIDDGHRLIQGHPGTSFIAGVVSAAYEKNISIEEFLSCLVVCYELTIRWAIAMQKEYNFLHSTGAYGAFGTALGISRIFQLSKAQLNTALSIADYHAPMTPVMRAVEYPSMNKDGVPFGALIGTMAVLETLAGTTGRTHLLESPDYAVLWEDLGKKFYILDLYFKPYTCCRWAHQPIKAICDLMMSHNFSNDDVESVVINTFRSAALLSKEIPNDTEEAQYNIAFPVACALVNGDVGYLQMRDEALNDTEVLEAMNKLEFQIDDYYQSQFPAKRLASVQIKLRDGRVFESGTYEAPGEPDDPNLNLNWIIEKFNRITKPIISEVGRQEVISAFTSLSDITIQDLVLALNKSFL